jgi:hypothetical protein
MYSMTILIIKEHSNAQKCNLCLAIICYIICYHPKLRKVTEMTLSSAKFERDLFLKLRLGGSFPLLLFLSQPHQQSTPNQPWFWSAIATSPPRSHNSPTQSASHDIFFFKMSDAPNPHSVVHSAQMIPPVNGGDGKDKKKVRLIGLILDHFLTGGIAKLCQLIPGWLMLLNSATADWYC